MNEKIIQTFIFFFVWFSLVIVSFRFISLNASHHCLTTNNYDAGDTGIDRKNVRFAICTCPCTKRNNDGSKCFECGHKQFDRSFIFIQTTQ